MIAYRVASYDTPCPPSPSRRDGRWGKAGGEVVNYWCEAPYTAWAEIYRYSGIQPDDVDGVSERLWVGRFDHIDLLDLDEDSAADWGTSLDELTGDEWGPCQAVAERLLEAGHREIRVPSAALPGTFNLVLFGQRLPIPLTAGVREPLVDIPCAVAADNSTGIPSVLSSVRHRGAPHPGMFTQTLPMPLS